MLRRFSQFRLPALPFASDALEPLYSARTIEFHHGKHHQIYVDKLNAAVGESSASLVSLITDQAQAKLGIRNFGGGHYNHSLFWLCLGPKSAGKPSGQLLAHIERDFQTFDKFKTEFEAAALGQFGSGWAWLSVGANGKLEVSNSANQDNPLMQGVTTKPGVPFFTVDVWEHAYYLQYQHKRAEFVEAFWRIVNWGQVQELYDDFAIKGKAVPADQLLK
jgi:Fe-Mn family superoxide dismutase